MKNEDFWKRVFAGRPDPDLLAEAERRRTTSTPEEVWIIQAVINTQRAMTLFQSPQTFEDSLAGVAEYALDWLRSNEVAGVDELRSKRISDAVEQIMDRHGEEFEVRPYSGRGMFGRMSAYAIDTSASPHSECGGALIALGLNYDTMGKGGYIYYLG